MIMGWLEWPVDEIDSNINLLLHIQRKELANGIFSEVDG